MSDNVEKDLEFVEYVMKSITDNSTNLKFERKIDNLGVLITVTAPHAESARIIGKGGETIKSIRHLAKIVGVNNKSRVNIKINAPELSQDNK